MSPTACADLIAAIARAAVRRRGRFDVVLPGGRSPVAVYRCLAAQRLSWHLWRIVPTDERCVPAGHPARNDAMLRAELIEPARASRRVLRSLPAEIGVERGARMASASLRATPVFDLVVVGLGGDGHTASLFGDAARASSHNHAPDVIGVPDAPAPPHARLSLSARRLARTRRLIVLVAGAGKQEALDHLLNGDDVPLAHVKAPQRLVVQLTEPAAH